MAKSREGSWLLPNDGEGRRTAFQWLQEEPSKLSTAAEIELWSTDFQDSHVQDLLRACPHLKHIVLSSSQLQAGKKQGQDELLQAGFVVRGCGWLRNEKRTPAYQAALTKHVVLILTLEEDNSISYAKIGGQMGHKRMVDSQTTMRQLQTAIFSDLRHEEEELLYAWQIQFVVGDNLFDTTNMECKIADAWGSRRARPDPSGCDSRRATSLKGYDFTKLQHTQNRSPIDSSMCN